MKLAIVSLMGGAMWGGSEALWYSLAKYSLAQGDAVLISVFDWETLHPKIQELKKLGAIIHLRKKFVGNVSFFKKIVRFIGNKSSAQKSDYDGIFEFNPDKIFISQSADFDLSLYHIPLYQSIRENNIPYSFVCHSHSQYSSIPETNIYPNAVEIFVNAKNVFFISKKQQLLTERKLVTRLSNAKFTWNPLNISKPFIPLNWPELPKINMAVVAVLDGTKGQDTLFEVLSRPEWKNRNWHINLYGEGIGEKFLKDLAKHYNIIDNITFHGFVHDITKVWENNHALLMPSSWEGMPISVVEAIMCGRIVIATDVGGISEIIDDNITGFIATSPTVEAYSNSMEAAWSRNIEWREIGIKAFEFMSAKIDSQPEQKIYNLL